MAGGAPAPGPSRGPSDAAPRSGYAKMYQRRLSLRTGDPSDTPSSARTGIAPGLPAASPPDPPQLRELDGGSQARSPEMQAVPREALPSELEELLEGLIAGFKAAHRRRKGVSPTSTRASTGRQQTAFTEMPPRPTTPESRGPTPSPAGAPSHCSPSLWQDPLATSASLPSCMATTQVGSPYDSLVEELLSVRGSSPLESQRPSPLARTAPGATLPDSPDELQARSASAVPDFRELRDFLERRHGSVARAFDAMVGEAFRASLGCSGAPGTTQMRMRHVLTLPELRHALGAWGWGQGADQDWWLPLFRRLDVDGDGFVSLQDIFDALLLHGQ